MLSIRPATVNDVSLLKDLIYELAQYERQAPRPSCLRWWADKPGYFNAFGKVIYLLPNMGMGVTFTRVEPQEMQVLLAWLHECA